MIAGLVGAVGPVSAQETDGVAPGTVEVKVKYFVDGQPAVSTDKAPLEGVEVFLWASGGHNACTDANGVATFEGITPGPGMFAVTGPAGVLFDECSNPFFLNPDNDDKMTSVFYMKHHGVRIWETFELGAGEELTIKFTAKTPNGQKKICGGLFATILGTGQPEELGGTEDGDVIVGKGGADLIFGHGGDDVICGGKVGDEIHGGDGNDWIRGGLGADTIFGDDGDDTMFGDEKNDTLDGGSGNDKAVGGDGNDDCTAETVVACEP